jgi:predicted  nucleic acid-binding Zn-ribbon protein
LREELVLLIELQKSDSAMSRIHARKKELPERLAKIEKDFRAVQELVDEARNRLDALQKDRSDKEGRLKKDGDTLRKAKDRLNEV